MVVFDRPRTVDSDHYRNSATTGVDHVQVSVHHSCQSESLVPPCQYETLNTVQSHVVEAAGTFVWKFDACSGTISKGRAVVRNLDRHGEE